MDATPPLGSMLAYDPMEQVGELGLRARGIVLQGSGLPIVLCAIDWIGIANESQDAFKVALAAAVGTLPDRVAIHTVHQHDAPISDFGAETILLNAGLDPGAFESTYQKSFIQELAKTVAASIERSVPITHIGTGRAVVKEVASNRRIAGPDGKIRYSRTSSTKDPSIRDYPEGLIDPEVSVVSFWNEANPVAVLSYYAVHPQSYYLTRIANPDFPGIARYMRQLAVPDALHVHFNGAGANVTAGKYNDGSKENRLLLAQRLADGMRDAWQNTVKTPLDPATVAWKTVPLAMDVAPQVEKIREDMKEQDVRWKTNNMQKLAWKERRERGKTIPVGCLYLGKERVLHLPGELFVEYQLAAKAFDPNLSVHMAAYGDYGPFYIGTKDAYDEGGYEIVTSPVTAAAEEPVMTAIEHLLSQKPAIPDASHPLLGIREEDGLVKPIRNIGEWQKKKEAVIAAMQEVMGELPSRNGLVALSLNYLDSMVEERFTRYTVSFESYPGFTAFAYLYLPKTSPDVPVPGMLVLHSTGDPGKRIVDGQTTLENRAVARELANSGYVVIAPDYPSYGDLKDHDFASDGFGSGTLLGIWNHMRSIDILQAIPQVHPERIGVIGHSLGGHNALFVAAFDERIRVVVSSCGWTPFGYYDIGEAAAARYGGRLGPWAQDRYMPAIKNYLPDKRLPFDFPEIIGSLAPRAFFSNSPLGDGNFSVAGVRAGISTASEVYRFFGLEDNLQVQYPEAGHDFPVETRKAAYAFLDKHLEHVPQHIALP
nr:alpha/beta fold hydrolase [Cytophagales bacterium]